ncbi:MAG TPA: 1-acyl-sn-glycerol-3-phosphate acyltransferase [Trebonia sp.]|nr:1-acyl-sn-glycerol-3-phosphate acyltransferase [Trebonia sp.]
MPLVMVIAVALTVLAPPLALFSAVFAAIRKSQTGRAHRMRTLRVACFALAWFLGETAALTVSGCLWIVSGFGGRLNTEPYRSRNYAVMRWLLDLIYHAAERTCGLSVHVAGPPGEQQGAASRPIIVLSRHAGPGDSLLVVHHLLTACGRRPRLVMKAALQLDPSLDVLGNRLPNAFIQHHRRTRTSTGPRHHTEQIKRLAAGLDEQSALVIFPEGANWTPLRWRRGIARLRKRGLPDLAERAAAMPNVLPPRTTGALVALAACPAADVIFVAHAGLDTLVSVRDVWQSLSSDFAVTARWWRVPADEVPRTAGHQAQVDWLYDWWRRIDAWISDQHARLPGSRDQDTYPERRAAGSPADALSRDRAQTRTPRFVRGGCDTAAMRTLSDSTDTRAGLPLTEAGLDAARHEVAWTLGDLPFHPGAASRSLWVVFLGAAGVWTHAVLPVDNALDKPDPGHITHLSEIVGMTLEFPLSRGSGEEALVVLRRPAPAAISEADAHVFRVVCEAAAARETAPWRFYVTGPDGARECFRQSVSRRPEVRLA